MPIPNRRNFILGAAFLPSCTAINSLNEASEPRVTFDLAPAPADQLRQGTRTILVLEPSAPAVIATDRMLIKPDALSVNYIPDARWSDDVPQMMQSLLIRSLSASGGFGFVGAEGSGPVPDFVLLTRIDQFGVQVQSDGVFRAALAMDLTILRDRDQRIIATRRFEGTATPTDDQAAPIAIAFQQMIDATLPEAMRWISAAV